MDYVLTHHGILGMKWGKRNGPPYPLNDSDKSAAEKKAEKENIKDLSDSELKKRVQRMNLEKSYKNLSKQNQKVSPLESTKKIVDSTSNMVNKAKQLSRESANKQRKPLDLSSMSDQELRDRINRFNLEQRYNDIFGDESRNVSRGHKYVDDILDVAGTALGIGSSAIAIALAIKELKK